MGGIQTCGHCILALEGIADVGGDILEVRHAVVIQRDTGSIIGYPQVRLPALLAPDDGDVLGLGVDTVLDELGHGLQRAALRKRDDRNRIPAIADAELAGAGCGGRVLAQGGSRLFPCP